MIEDILEGLECTVIDECYTSDWFKVKSRVKQCCVILGFLFLLVTDWVMRNTKADKRKGIQWNFTMVLEDLDFGHDRHTCSLFEALR